MKTPPAFDALNLSSPENSLFGTKDKNTQHFTQFGFDNDKSGGTYADAKTIRMMNPMTYICDNDVFVAPNWRIRHGLADRDGSIAIPVILATKLLNQGKNVDILLPWATPHSGDYDLEELFTWIDSICK